MLVKRIFLVGFRATGKSTVSKILAKKLNWSFVDMDFLISQQAGERIDILTKNGSNWEEFREIENQILGELSTMNNIVISCGGGVGVNDIVEKNTKRTYAQLNKKILRGSKDSLVVLLNLNEKEIEKRLKRQYKNKKIMPLLNEEKAKEMKSELDTDQIIEKQVKDSMTAYEKRKPLYDDLTDIKINTDKLSPDNVVNKIIEVMKNE